MAANCMGLRPIKRTMSLPNDVECHRCDTEMNPAHQIGSYRCPHCGCGATVTPADHAYDHWHKRADDPSVAPMMAWEDSLKVVEGHGFDADEVRYHHETQTVLLRKDIAIVTVIDVPTARRKGRKAVLQSLIAHDAPNEMISDVCRSCGFDKDVLKNLMLREKLRERGLDRTEAKAKAGSERGNGPASDADASGRNRYSRSGAKAEDAS